MLEISPSPCLWILKTWILLRRGAQQMLHSSRFSNESGVFPAKLAPDRNPDLQIGVLRENVLMPGNIVRALAEYLREHGGKALAALLPHLDEGGAVLGRRYG
jgi:hypothetical protein